MPNEAFVADFYPTVIQKAYEIAKSHNVSNKIDGLRKCYSLQAMFPTMILKKQAVTKFRRQKQKELQAVQAEQPEKPAEQQDKQQVKAEIKTREYYSMLFSSKHFVCNGLGNICEMQISELKSINCVSHQTPFFFHRKRS